MKHFLFLFLAISFSSFSQKTAVAYSEEPIAFVTSKKDTLYLINDKLGKTIANSWEGNYYDRARDGEKPCILLVDISYIRNRYKNTKTVILKQDAKKKLLTQKRS